MLKIRACFMWRTTEGFALAEPRVSLLWKCAGPFGLPAWLVEPSWQGLATLPRLSCSHLTHRLSGLG